MVPIILLDEVIQRMWLSDDSLARQSNQRLLTHLLSLKNKKINNLIYVDDTILMAESEEELKSLLMKVKEETEKLT